MVACGGCVYESKETLCKAASQSIIAVA